MPTRQVESVPALALGAVLRWRLARSPETATFLRPAERQWLAGRCAPVLIPGWGHCIQVCLCVLHAANILQCRPHSVFNVHSARLWP